MGNGAAILYERSAKIITEPIAANAPPLYNVLYNKWFVDEGYDYVFTGRRKIGNIRLGAMGAGEAASWFDAKIIDGAVNDVGWVTRAVATLSTWWDKWIIDGVGVNGPAILARMISVSERACSNGDWCSGTRWSWSRDCLDLACITCGNEMPALSYWLLAVR